MSEDNVCESWEELIKDDNTNDNKPNEDSNSSDKKSNGNHQLNYKLNGLVINDKRDKQSINSNKNGKPSAKSNKGANNSTYLFKNVQIKFEDDNLRNHFVTQIQQHQNPKVKILQRPKEQQEEVKNDDIASNLIKNGFYNAKTIQEREAEYAKARLRILGPNYENEDQIEQSSINNQLDRKTESLVRKPQGPTIWNFDRNL